MQTNQHHRFKPSKRLLLARYQHIIDLELREEIDEAMKGTVHYA